MLLMSEDDAQNGYGSNVGSNSFPEEMKPRHGVDSNALCWVSALTACFPSRGHCPARRTRCRPGSRRHRSRRRGRHARGPGGRRM